MPWFPDFVAGAELARREIGDAGHADPVAQYLTALTRGDAHALETTWPGHIVVLDPYAGEVHGHRALHHFVQTSQAFLADRLMDVEQVATTHAGDRAVVELLAHLQLDGAPVLWPVAVVVQWDDDRSVTFRTYGSQWPVVGHRPIRPPILDPDPATATNDVVTRYLAALDIGDADAAWQSFTVDGYVREPIGPRAFHRGSDELARWFAEWLHPGGGIGIDRCCATDDGTRCALEYNCVRWAGRPVPAQAGLTVFERDGHGLLAAARYYDDIAAPVDR